MKVITAITLLIAMCICAACSAVQEDELTAQAITALLAKYPKANLQDVYKSFYQERFGPGHMIPNVQNARDYLMSELDEAHECEGDYYEPTGSHGNYIRIYLHAVSDGIISAEDLLDAFVSSANNVKPASGTWAEQWNEIVRVIDNKQLPVPSTDTLRQQLKDCSEKDEAVHHSTEYETNYHPHFRIVERNIFEDKLKALIDK